MSTRFPRNHLFKSPVLVSILLLANLCGAADEKTSTTTTVKGTGTVEFTPPAQNVGKVTVSGESVSVTEPTPKKKTLAIVELVEKVSKKRGLKVVFLPAASRKATQVVTVPNDPKKEAEGKTEPVDVSTFSTEQLRDILYAGGLDLISESQIQEQITKKGVVLGHRELAPRLAEIGEVAANTFSAPLEMTCQEADLMLKLLANSSINQKTVQAALKTVQQYNKNYYYIASLEGELTVLQHDLSEKDHVTAICQRADAMSDAALNNISNVILLESMTARATQFFRSKAVTEMSNILKKENKASAPKPEESKPTLTNKIDDAFVEAVIWDLKRKVWNLDVVEKDPDPVLVLERELRKAAVHRFSDDTVKSSLKKVISGLPLLVFLEDVEAARKWCCDELEKGINQMAGERVVKLLEVFEMSSGGIKDVLKSIEVTPVTRFFPRSQVTLTKRPPLATLILVDLIRSYRAYADDQTSSIHVVPRDGDGRYVVHFALAHAWSTTATYGRPYASSSTDGSMTINGIYDTLKSAVADYSANAGIKSDASASLTALLDSGLNVVAVVSGPRKRPQQIANMLTTFAHLAANPVIETMSDGGGAVAAAAKHVIVQTTSAVTEEVLDAAQALEKSKEYLASYLENEFEPNFEAHLAALFKSLSPAHVAIVTIETLTGSKAASQTREIIDIFDQATLGAFIRSLRKPLAFTIEPPAKDGTVGQGAFSTNNDPSLQVNGAGPQDILETENDKIGRAMTGLADTYVSVPKSFAERVASAAPPPPPPPDPTIKVGAPASGEEAKAGLVPKDGRMPKLAGPAVAVDMPNNSLVVVCPPFDPDPAFGFMEFLDGLIEQLDCATSMVEISVAIADLQTNKSEEWGSRFTAVGNGKLDANPVFGAAGFNTPSGSDGKPPGLLTNSLSPAPPGVPDITSGAVAGQGLNVGGLVVGSSVKMLATFRALEIEGDAKMLARPSVLTMDNSEAVITEETKLYLSAEGLNTGVLTEVPTGLAVIVTPQIVKLDDGRHAVRMRIKVKEGGAPPTTNTLGVVSVDNSQLKTTALVEQGQSLLIAGRLHHDEGNAESRVPILGKIPLVGRAFKNATLAKSRRQRLILVTPTIVDPGKYHSEAAEQAARPFGSSGPLPLPVK